MVLRRWKARQHRAIAAARRAAAVALRQSTARARCLHRGKWRSGCCEATEGNNMQGPQRTCCLLPFTGSRLQTAATMGGAEITQTARQRAARLAGATAGAATQTQAAMRVRGLYALQAFAKTHLVLHAVQMQSHCGGHMVTPPTPPAASVCDAVSQTQQLRRQQTQAADNTQPARVSPSPLGAQRRRRSRASPQQQHPQRCRRAGWEGEAHDCV